MNNTHRVFKTVTNSQLDGLWTIDDYGQIEFRDGKTRVFGRMIWTPRYLRFEIEGSELCEWLGEGSVLVGNFVS